MEQDADVREQQKTKQNQMIQYFGVFILFILHKNWMIVI